MPRETLLDAGTVHELLGLQKPEALRLSIPVKVDKLNVTDTVDMRTWGKWFRSSDVIAFLHAHARREDDQFLHEIADQLSDHAGLPRSI